MLNELLTLRRDLQAAGHDLPDRHPDVKRPGRAPGFRVGLDADGLPADVEGLTGDAMACLWTIREGKHNSFPVVKVRHALLDVPSDAPVRAALRGTSKDDVAARAALLREALDAFPVRLTRNDANLWARLREKAGVLRSVFGDGQERWRALPLMLARFASPAVDPAQLLDALARLLIRRLAEARLDDAALAERLMLGRADAAASGPAVADVPLVFDVAEQLDARVASREMEAHVSRCLSSRPARAAADGVCALTGVPQVLETGLFPAPNLPLLGETYLISMNDEIPCQTRYGLTGTSVVPLGRRTARDLENAITFITRPELRRRTWRPVANGKFEVSGGRKKERQDLLVVWVEGRPVVAQNLADLFGTDAEGDRRQFEVDAQAVCDALEGIARERPHSRLDLLLLRKADKGRTHAVLSEVLAVEQVLDGARRWQRTASNLPDIVLPLPGRAGERAVAARPTAPHPEQVVRLLQQSWVVSGTRAVKVEGIGLATVLDLFLRRAPQDRQAADLMLDLAVERFGPLLIGVAGAERARDPVKWKLFPPTSRDVALAGASVLAILLDAVSRQKEEYMQGTAFQVGRLLALADTLHREYCLHVRGGGVPPQLVGNALMAAAADNPLEAVDRLRERTLVYLAWAQKASGPDVGLAKWAARQIGQACAALAAAGPLPTTADRVARAELFLGYMARVTGANGPVNGGDAGEPKEGANGD